MKYLTNFKTKEEYEAFKAGGSYLTPNVSFIETAGSVINDSYQVPTSGEGGGSGETIYVKAGLGEMGLQDFLDLLSCANLYKEYRGSKWRIGQIAHKYVGGFNEEELYEECKAVSINLDDELYNNGFRFYVRDLIGELDFFNSLTLITKEEFYNLDNGGSSLIEFTINGTPYKAGEGMTWQEFVESSYNDGNIIYDAQYYSISYNGNPILNNGRGVDPDTEIISGTDYTSEEVG